MLVETSSPDVAVFLRRPIAVKRRLLMSFSGVHTPSPTSVTMSERQSHPQAFQLDPEPFHPAECLLKFDYEQVRSLVGLSPWQLSSRGQLGL